MNDRDALVCSTCGHEIGEHVPFCEKGMNQGRPCGCRGAATEALVALMAPILYGAVAYDHGDHGDHDHQQADAEGAAAVLADAILTRYDVTPKCEHSWGLAPDGGRWCYRCGARPAPVPDNH